TVVVDEAPVPAIVPPVQRITTFGNLAAAESAGAALDELDESSAAAGATASSAAANVASATCEPIVLNLMFPPIEPLPWRLLRDRGHLRTQVTTECDKVQSFPAN